MERLRDRQVASSALDRQGLNFESCVWKAMSPHSSHHPQKVLLGQFSQYVHKGGLKSHSFHFCLSLYHRVHTGYHTDMEYDNARGTQTVAAWAIYFGNTRR